MAGAAATADTASREGGGEGRAKGKGGRGEWADSAG